MAACAGRGRYPIQFGGSIFTVDGTKETAGNRGGLGIPDVYDADFRMWGRAYWFQNTRLLYWHALMAGDFDIMRPLFRMYRAALPLAEERTRLCFRHAGAFFPETMMFWGTYLNENYGVDRTGKTISGSDVVAAVRVEKSRGPWKPGEVANTYIRHHLNGNLELLAMMLDYHAFTGDEHFRNETLLPLARAILTFYREHYRRRCSSAPPSSPGLAPTGREAADGSGLRLKSLKAFRRNILRPCSMRAVWMSNSLNTHFLGGSLIAARIPVGDRTLFAIHRMGLGLKDGQSASTPSDVPPPGFLAPDRSNWSIPP